MAERVNIDGTRGWTTERGPSILELLWRELDAAMKQLMGLPDGSAGSTKHEKAKSECLGIAKCIAIMINPYTPDIDAVREEAMQRYTSHGYTTKAPRSQGRSRTNRVTHKSTR